MRVHHTAICTADVDTSLRFWVEGIGLTPLMDRHFDGDWPTLFDAPGTRLRSVFLGDPADPESGILELVDFLGEVAGPGPSIGVPGTGFLLVSLYVDVDETLDRLDRLGLGGLPRRITLPGPVSMAVVRDPNGVAVELITRQGGPATFA